MKDSTAYWQLTLTAALWGFSWICGRIISSEGIPAVHGALGRFVFGSAGLLVIMLFNTPWPRVGGRMAVRLLAMGFAGVFFYNVCFFTGLQTVPAGRASLMAALQPSIVFLFAASAWGERVTPLKIAGLIVSLAGAVVVLSQGNPARLFVTGFNTGELWVLGCVLSWVSYTLLGRALMGRIAALAATAYSTWAGTLMLVVYAFVRRTPSPEWSLNVWLAAGFLGLGGTTIAFLLYLRGLAHIGPARTSIFINLVPVFGVIFSALVLREGTGLATLGGGALVIAGVRMLNRR